MISPPLQKNLTQFGLLEPIPASVSVLKHLSNLSLLFELNKKIISLSRQTYSIKQESVNAKNAEEKIKQACFNASSVEFSKILTTIRELNRGNKKRAIELSIKEAELSRLKDEFKSKIEVSKKQIQELIDLEQEDLRNLSGLEHTLNKRVTIAKKNLEEAFEVNKKILIQAKLSLETLKERLSSIATMRQIHLENIIYMKMQFEMFNLEPNAKIVSEEDYKQQLNGVPLQVNSFEIIKDDRSQIIIQVNVTPSHNKICRYELVGISSPGNKGVLEIRAVPDDSLQNPFNLTFTIDKNLWGSAEKTSSDDVVHILSKNELGKYQLACKIYSPSNRLLNVQRVDP